MRIIFLAGFLTFFVFTASPLQAALRINEIYPAPPTGDYEWIELYNDEATSFSIAGYKIQDAANNAIHLIGSTIDPFTFIVATSSGVLNNSGDTVYLKNNGDEVVEIATYSGTFTATKSIAKCPDGTGTWTTSSAPTKLQSNSAGCPQPSPTITPMMVPTNIPSPTATLPSATSDVASIDGPTPSLQAPTPSPTNTPRPTRIPTPTPTPRPSATTTPSSTPTPTRTPTPSPTQIPTATLTPTPTPTEILLQSLQAPTQMPLSVILNEADEEQTKTSAVATEEVLGVSSDSRNFNSLKARLALTSFCYSLLSLISVLVKIKLYSV